MEPVRLIFPLEDRSILAGLEAGEKVLVSGTIYTARDAAHARLVEELAKARREAGNARAHGAGAQAPWSGSDGVEHAGGEASQLLADVSRVSAEAQRDFGEERRSGGEEGPRSRDEAQLLPFPPGSCIYYAGPAMTRDGRITAIGPTTASRMDTFAPVLYEWGVAATLGKGPRAKEVAEACRAYGAVYLVTYGGAASYLASFVRKATCVAYRDLGPEAIYRLEVEDFPAYVGIDTRGHVFPALP